METNHGSGAETGAPRGDDEDSVCTTFPPASVAVEEEASECLDTEEAPPKRARADTVQGMTLPSALTKSSPERLLIAALVSALATTFGLGGANAITTQETPEIKVELVIPEALLRGLTTRLDDIDKGQRKMDKTLARVCDKVALDCAE